MTLSVPIPFIVYLMPLLAAAIALTPALRQFFMPRQSSENWYLPTIRLMLSLFVLTFPFLFDGAVPEVSGDMRWYLIHTLTLVMTTLFFAHRYQTAEMPLRLPVTLSTTAAKVLIAIAALTLIWTLSPILSWWSFKHLLSYTLLMFFFIQSYDLRWYRNICWVIALGVGLNGLIGIFQFLGYTDYAIIDYFRQAAPPAGSLANKNLAASYLILTLPICAYLFLTTQRRPSQLLAGLCFTLGTILLVYTRSRGSWISAIFALLLLGGWLFLHRKYLPTGLITKPKMAITAAGLVAIVGFSQLETGLRQGYHSIHNSVAEQFSSIGDINRNDLGPRMAYNINGLKILLDHPFGVGIGAFHTIYPKYHNAWVDTPEVGYNLTARPRRAHNDLMQMFIDTGFIGGFAMIALFLSLFTMTWQITRSSGAVVEQKLLASALFIGSVGLSINALGDFPLQMPTAPALLWSFTGMLTALFMAVRGESLKYITVNITKPAALLLTLAALISTAAITYDSVQRRISTVYLKPAMGLAHEGMNNDLAVMLINKAHDIYPYNQRLQEMRGVILNAHGKVPPHNIKLSDDDVIAALKEHLKYDPYAQNTLLNLAFRHLKQSQKTAATGDLATAMTQLYAAEKYGKQAVALASIHPNADTVYGLILLTLGRTEQALIAFTKALAKNPTYQPALTGKKQAQAKWLQQQQRK